MSRRVLILIPILLSTAPITAQTHLTRQVNYEGHCQASADRPAPCDSMSLVYDLDHDSQVTVVFAKGPGIAAQFPGKACTFEKKEGNVVGVDCGEWLFRVGVER
jgi:hypothetical protein